MTIAAAWVRTLKDCQELVFVTDSRLSGDGRLFDACPKVLTLPRSDCAIAFAGYTGDAFPMLLQLSLAIDSHAPAKRGSLDLAAFRSHALKVFDGMADQIAPSPHISVAQDITPDAGFIFGGYSWVKKKFQLWSITFDAGPKRFAAHPSQWCGYSKSLDRIVLRKKAKEDLIYSLGRIAFAGDQAGAAKKLLLERLNANGAAGDRRLDMEPFEVIRDMLRDPNHNESIGGAPQVVKVYQYMRSATVAVYWPQKAGGAVHLHGRACLGYERIDPWILDPDTLMSEKQ